MRLVLFSVITLLVAACTYGTTAPPPTTAPVQLDTTEFDASVDSLNANLMSHELDTDLDMAWSDLRGDLRSVVRDLVRNPQSVDTEGMAARLESFWASFGHDPILSSFEGQWTDLVEAFADLSSEGKTAIAGQSN